MEIAAPIKVILTPRERERFIAVGRERHEAAAQRGYKKKPGEPWRPEWHENGAVAEGTACKYLGVPYRPLAPGVLDFDDDIVKDVGVKSTEYKKGNLIIQEHNKYHAAFVFVTENAGLHPVIQGWTWGWYARQIGEHRSGGQWSQKAFWVPMDKLFWSQPRMRLLRYMTEWAAKTESG